MAWNTFTVKLSHIVWSGRNGIPPRMLSSDEPRNVADEPEQAGHLEADEPQQVVVDGAPDDRRP